MPAFLLLALLGGCARPGGVLPPAGGAWDDQAALEKIEAQAKGIRGLFLRGYVRLSYRGRSRPRVSFTLNWRRDREGDHLRVRGTGPLGMTVFDLLMDKKALWLYIPRYNRVFWQPAMPGTGREEPDASGYALEPALLLREAGLALNPWMVTLCRYPSSSTGRTDITILCRRDGREGARASFRKDFTVCPYRLATRNMEIAYHGPAVLHGLRNACYPAGVEVDLTRVPLHLEVEFRDTRANPLSEPPGTFDSSPFATLPVSSFDELLSALR